MKKLDLISAVANKTKSSKGEVTTLLNAVLESIQEGVKKDGSVQIMGFGTFNLVNRVARMGRNPQTGESIKIKASKSVGFKVGKAFKSSL